MGHGKTPREKLVHAGAEVELPEGPETPAHAVIGSCGRPESAPAL